VVEKNKMKKSIFIICLFFLFSTPLLSKEEKICDWIITGGKYQKYLDDLPSSNFHSAFYVVVGKDGRCSYGWDWEETHWKKIEQVLQDSFNDCEKWRKKDYIDGGECKPYDINAEIVWGKPELYEKLVGSKMKTNEEMIAFPSEEACQWIFYEEYQKYLNDLPSSDFHSAFYVAVESRSEKFPEGRCAHAWRWEPTPKLLEKVISKTFADCEYWRAKNNLKGECKPYDINAEIVWNKPELYKELTKSNIKKPEEKITTSSKGICDWIFADGKYQRYLYELPKADFHSAFHVVVGSDGRCTFGWQWNYTRKNMLTTRGVQFDTVQGSFNYCEKWRKEYEIDGECKPYDIDTEIVWNKPEHKILKLLATHKKILDEIAPKKEYSDYDFLDEDDVTMYGLDNIINSTDPSTLQKVIYIGEEKRNIVEPWTEREDKSRRFIFKTTVSVFDAYYENGKIFEILIYFKNEENKSKDRSTSLAEEYAFVIGLMPNILLQRLDAAHIFPDSEGVSNACACDRVIAIHPTYEGGYHIGTAIEELFIHELVHASLDKPFYGSYKSLNKKRHKNDTIKSKKLNWGYWRKALKKDKKKYITEYAKTSIHEDLAESFTAWVALRYKVHRISDLQKQKIENLIPNRIKFFDEQNFDMYPLVLSN